MIKFKLAVTLIIVLFILRTNNSQAIQKRTKNTSVTGTQSETYTVPQREIRITPYVNFIYAKDIYIDFVDDQFSIGGGMMIRTQAYGPFGYFIDASYNKMDVNINPAAGDKGLEAVLLSTLGLYYSYDVDFGQFCLDLGYGVITAGNNAMTIFIPGVGFNKEFYSRVSYTAKLGYLITNDWFTNMDLKEKYTSVSLSVGISAVF